jgi:hypothetical protein
VSGKKEQGPRPGGVCCLPGLVVLATLAMGCGPEAQGPVDFVAMTFNAGTTTGLAHDRGDDPYTSAEAAVADALYHNSLSWNPAEEALRSFIADRHPQIVALQEIFYDPWCEEIDVDPTLDFVCKGYDRARPLQVQRLVGEGYRVACHRDHPDKCVAVERAFATFSGCQDDLCLDALDGEAVEGCGHGARVGHATLELGGGGRLELVSVHLTSGFEASDQACRLGQLRQIFEDRGDGQPAASSSGALVLGDFNTDPFALNESDESAGYLDAHVGPGTPFHWLSSSTADGPATYAEVFRIDHLFSNTVEGRGPCEVPGAGGRAPVMETIYWDHRPVLCPLRLR